MSRLVGGITWPRYIAGYVLWLGGSLLVAFLAARLLALDAMRVLLAECAAFFAVAALGRPRPVFLLARNIGAASLIGSERTVRLMFAGFAVLLVVLSNWVPRGMLPTTRREREGAPAAEAPPGERGERLLGPTASHRVTAPAEATRW